MLLVQILRETRNLANGPRKDAVNLVHLTCSSVSNTTENASGATRPYSRAIEPDEERGLTINITTYMHSYIRWVEPSREINSMNAGIYSNRKALKSTVA